MNTPPAGSTATALLAGDVLRNTPIHSPLRLLKGLYYAASLLNFRRTLKASRMRKHNIRVVDETGAAMN
ncbi:hypothetical protein [Sulfuricella sp.]|uniref:hypothetical protein n=1 Tax=Sulfuricella sp. TaxID=2099377 RepID=UPI002CC81F02|nr:hypothetical protein [Sulfuricella sp.]HUX63508.1 hypothetical protein [Sulfuricella sp.]